jgi:predicted RNase H-like HicB family nuclease
MSKTLTKRQHVTTGLEAVTYTVHFIPEDIGGYSVIVPVLPGCYSQGETLLEAERYAVEAIQLYLESLKEHGEIFPEETPASIEKYFADFSKDVSPLPGYAPMVWKRLSVPVDHM